MNTRTILALAALALSALGSTAASATEFSSSGRPITGYFGNDYGRQSHIWAPQRKHYDPCECEQQAPVVHRTYVPVRVPVYVPVKVRVPVYVPVKVRVPVYVPVKVSQPDPCDCEETAPSTTRYVPRPRPSHIEAAPQTEECECEETTQYQPNTHPGHRPGHRQYDQAGRQASNQTSIEK